ncbi:hypothetical protein H7F50_06630 [Novosphingobium flavum]|uniref:YCII-related domain-containing protein n=1 Tax=Novosphingobium aerophilum TaxID=2839843 RepID=A0A7X1F793_9SPHN|nr:hypothetical protein [Novosphingobium aerophilum]MBC2651662.1 hypothetical protein [Novosphingobium aerophilum]MBC2661426.1 hypothetical protein [Novosphingobium aerophilum]
MKDFILLMHGDAVETESDLHWQAYFQRLHASGAFAGGSSIGAGQAYRRAGAPGPLSPLTGFIRIRAADHAEAATFLEGNPVYIAGGTVEIRELPHD